MIKKSRAGARDDVNRFKVILAVTLFKSIVADLTLAAIFVIEKSSCFRVLGVPYPLNSQLESLFGVWFAFHLRFSFIAALVILRHI